MPIGRFARSCRLSVKALRHYDELGLLAPAFVDPQSRYRYYSREQARDAVMIGMLRSLDLPLDAIRDLLRASPDELSALVDGESARIEAEIARKESALLSLRHLSHAGGLAAYEVDVREHPARLVARMGAVTDAASLISDTTALVYALFEAVSQCKAEPRESPFVLNTFHEDRDRIELEACIEIEASTRDAEALLPPRLELAELPGGSFASLVHVGPYETLGLAHHALIAWMQERGHATGTTVWEFYRNDPADVATEALETEVAIPIDD